jgi:hypothetical protein
MDIEELWSKALKQTEVIRARLQELATFEATPLPYIFLAESSLNSGDTVVRKGQIMVERPSLILPSPQFQGFEFEQELHISEDAMLNFLLVRGVRFPSLRYKHELSSLDLREGSLQQAITTYHEQLKQAEDIHTGLVIGPEDAWQCSVLILVGSLVIRSAESDVRRLLDSWKRRREG